MSATLDHLSMYRLPWSLADNGISWLEPTAQCNLSCDGCYRNNRVEHKTWEQTLGELDVFTRLRKSDALSIAGGDPLLYPDIVRTIEEAGKRGYKPVINTNGQALNQALLRQLKDAGLAGFTFHIDSKQGRAGKWKKKSEMELCELRNELADMAASIDVSCAFNATIYPDTLGDVAPLAKWAEDHMDKVHVMVFILYRDVLTRGYRFFNGDQEIALDSDEAAAAKKRGKNGNGKDKLVYNFDVEKGYDTYLKAQDVVAALRADNPDFRPSAYLNGSEDPASFKWLLAGRLGRPGKTYGYVGPKFQELVQSTHHLLRNRYLAYAPPDACRLGKPTMLLSALDDGVRQAGKKFLQDAVRSPLAALTQPVYYQSVLIIQPIDMLEDGRMNMCDGCPDITVFDGRLVWSCRMDELERHGRNLWAEPKVEPALDKPQKPVEMNA